MTRLLRLVLLSSLCALPCLAQEEGLPLPTGLRRVTRTHGPAWRIVRTERDAEGRRSALVLVRVMRTHGPGYRWVRIPARPEQADQAALRAEEEARAALGAEGVQRVQQELQAEALLDAATEAASGALRRMLEATPTDQAPPAEAQAGATTPEAAPAPAPPQAVPAAAPAGGVIDQLEQGGEKASPPPPPPPTRRPRRVS